MTATSAIQEMKAAMDSLMKANLAPKKDGEKTLSQMEQENLAKRVVEAVKRLDNIFEEAKLQVQAETASSVEDDIAEMQEILAQKEALLRKSLDRVERWEERFAALRESQKPLLFQS